MIDYLDYNQAHDSTDKRTKIKRDNPFYIKPTRNDEIKTITKQITQQCINTYYN